MLNEIINGIVTIIDKFIRAVNPIIKEFLLPLAIIILYLAIIYDYVISPSPSLISGFANSIINWIGSISYNFNTPILNVQGSGLGAIVLIIIYPILMIGELIRSIAEGVMLILQGVANATVGAIQTAVANIFSFTWLKGLACALRTLTASGETLTTLCCNCDNNSQERILQMNLEFFNNDNVKTKDVDNQLITIE
jgi:hypothetical protein